MSSESHLEQSKAPFLEHLGELRQRLFRAIAGVCVAAIGCFLLHDQIFTILAEPLRHALEANGLPEKMVYRSPAGAFVFHLKTAILGGFVLGLPIVLYQLWMFVAPGLYRHEQKFALPFVALSTVCFIGGGLFAYNFVMPQAFGFLVGYTIDAGPVQLVPDIAVEDYLGFTTKLLLAFGLVFEMPVAIGFLAWIGLVTHKMLIRFWRWAVVLAFVLGSFLTPPDYITQIMLAIPIICLYGISIGVAYVLERKRDESFYEDDEAEDEGDESTDDSGDDTQEPVALESSVEGEGEEVLSPEEAFRRRQLNLDLNGDQNEESDGDPKDD